MFYPIYGPALWNALEMAPLSEESYYNRTGFSPSLRPYRDYYRRLMVKVARLMVATGTRLNSRYGYAS